MESNKPMEPMAPIDRVKTGKSITAQDDFPGFAGKPYKSAKKTFKDDQQELKKSDRISRDRDKQRAVPITPFNEVREEKKRLKSFNIIMILVFLILVVGGTILLILPMMERTEPSKNVVEHADKNKNTTGDIVKIEEKTAPVKEDTTKPGEIPEKTKTGKPGEKTGEKKPAITSTAQTPLTTSITPGKAAEAYFLEGSLITAGNVWKQELRKAGAKYGILLELDCMKESVMNAYDRISAKKDFYILNRNTEGKICFLVMWGKFLTYEQADEAIKSTAILSYFWQQKDKPRIADLSNFL